MEDLALQQKKISDIKSNLSYYLVNKIPDLGCYNSMVLARNNIFFNGILAMMNLKNGEWLLSGHCEGMLHFGAFADARIHIADDSDIVISADAPSMLRIDVYNNSKVTVKSNGKPKIIVILHGQLASVNAPENVTTERI